MMLRLHHIGITVGSLNDASKQLEPALGQYHIQRDIQTPACVNQVAARKQSSLDITLHKSDGCVDVELIQYSAALDYKCSLLPWHFDGKITLTMLKKRLESSRMQSEQSAIDKVSSLNQNGSTLNSVAIFTDELRLESEFWQSLGFKLEASNDYTIVLSLAARIPPMVKSYIIITQSEKTSERFTDYIGLNEIALLCTSVSSILSTVDSAIFHTQVSRMTIAGNPLDICFLKSPSGVLAELFSVAH